MSSDSASLMSDQFAKASLHIPRKVLLEANLETG